MWRWIAGGPYLDAHLQCLNQDGRLVVVIGVMGGAQATLNLGLLLVKAHPGDGLHLAAQPAAGAPGRRGALAGHISCRRLCAVNCAGRWIGSALRRRPGACLGGQSQ